MSRVNSAIRQGVLSAPCAVTFSASLLDVVVTHGHGQDVIVGGILLIGPQHRSGAGQAAPLERSRVSPGSVLMLNRCQRGVAERVPG